MAGDTDGAGRSELDELRRQHRERMDRIDAWMLRLGDTVSCVALGTSLGVALVVLTATSWQITRNGRGRNAWEVASVLGWPGGLALTLVLVLALGTLTVSLRRSVSVAAHRTVAAAGVLTVLAVLLTAAFTRSPTAPTAGLWLTAVASAALVVLHVRWSRTIRRTLG